MVSIITPSYNSEKYIKAAIESVINQTHKDWELIVVDDGSVDNTINIVTKLSNQNNRIKLFKQPKNLGVALARNRGIKESKGNYMAFLDADDIWKPHKLEVQLTLMQDQDAAVSYSSYELINEQGEKLKKLVQALPKLSYKKQLKSNYIGNLTGIYNVDLLGKIYMPEIKKRQDWVLWLKALKKGGYAIGIQESLAYYRIRKGSISSNKFSLMSHNFNVYRTELDYGFFKSVKYFLVFLYEHFFIKSKQIKRMPEA